MEEIGKPLQRRALLYATCYDSATALDTWLQAVEEGFFRL